MTVNVRLFERLNGFLGFFELELDNVHLVLLITHSFLETRHFTGEFLRLGAEVGGQLLVCDAHRRQLFTHAKFARLNFFC